MLVESQVRLDLLEDPALRAAFVRVNCDWYLTALEHAHKVHLDYCTQVKRGALVPGSSVEISLAMFAARLAVLAYARWIVAHIDETQPETIAWAAAALAPIDALREQKRQQMAKAEAKRAEAQKPAAGAAPPVAPAPAPASKPTTE